MATSAEKREQKLTEILSLEDYYRSWGYIVQELEKLCIDGTNGFEDYFQTLLDMVADGKIKEWGGSSDRNYELIKRG